MIYDSTMSLLSSALIMSPSAAWRSTNPANCSSTMESSFVIVGSIRRTFHLSGARRRMIWLMYSSKLSEFTTVLIFWRSFGFMAFPNSRIGANSFSESTRECLSARPIARLVDGVAESRLRRRLLGTCAARALCDSAHSRRSSAMRLRNLYENGQQHSIAITLSS